MDITSTSFFIRNRNYFLYFLFFLSGTTALIYEVLWMKELGLLFGNTTYAAATTLSVFFLGLSAGGYTWGRISKRLKKPLRAYGLLEFCIAISACLYFFLLASYRIIYSSLFVFFVGNTALFTGIKLLLSVGILFLPAFFMGGTLPIMGQYLIRQPRELAITGTLLYALNTIGAAIGAFLAGFILPQIIGFKLSYLAAICVNILIGGIALALSMGREARRAESRTASFTSSPISTSTGENYRFLWFLALGSGFLTLGLEVLWTRMFSQVLQNSVYTFSMILIIFLFALALGSFLANILSRRQFDHTVVLTFLLILSGLAVGTCPIIFNFITDGLKEIRGPASWVGYIFSIFSSISVVIFIPGLLIGSVFPYLLKTVQGSQENPGLIIGRLVSINTVGALFGSLFAGFVSLNTLGLWSSIKTFAICYFLLSYSVILFYRKNAKDWYAVAITAVFVLFLTYAGLSRFPVVSIDPTKETILDITEGSHATVAVIKKKDNIRLKLNNHYQLGNTHHIKQQRIMAELPLLIHPNAKFVFFIGLGTGITANASLAFPVEKVTVCELYPEVIQASKKFFSQFAHELYEDPRANVVIEDGRNYLVGTKETYDVIVADLFLPWKAGVSSLYTVEHFQTVRSKLNDDGMFVQWLPLWQNSREEFSIIARTMLEAFEQITFWRGNFSSLSPMVALIGHKNPQSLEIDAVVGKYRRYIGNEDISSEFVKASILIYYSGNLSKTRAMFAKYPLNTDDLPLMEYLAPITRHNQATGQMQWFSDEELYSFFKDIFSIVPPENDPYLKNLSKKELDYVQAGQDLYAYGIYKRKDRGRSLEFKKRFMECMPLELKAISSTL